MITVKPEGPSVVLEEDDIIALYLELDQRDDLDQRMAVLHTRLERLLFQKLTIQDFESLQNNYQAGKPILTHKGE